jgi:hypothetical protein
VVGVRTCKFTVSDFAGAGELVRLTVVVLVVPALKLPHADAATTVNVVVGLAFAELRAPTVSQEAEPLESSATGVPPVAAEVMVTVLAGPGV